MGAPTLLLRLPDASTVSVGAEAVIGRAGLADVRVLDPRVSTVHAELSWRDEGFVVLARGGRVLVDGAPAAEAPLAPGSRITLAPGVVLEVLEITGGEAPVVPRTAGRDRLTLRVCGMRVELLLGQEPQPREVVEGLPAQLLVALLRAPGPLSWEEAAAELWPEEGAVRARRGPLRTDAWTPIDERRFRNRFDQVLATLRSQLRRVRPVPLVRLERGELTFASGPSDRVEDPR